MSQASRGIEVAHASGIVHRDLKPQNLFVCRREDGTDLLKVLDFGVAKLQAIDEMNAATRTGTIVGTVAYMSPEQARGDKVVDHRADVYALGAILYELCSRQRPHPGESNNAVLHHISAHPAVPLESVQPGLPAGLVDDRRARAVVRSGRAPTVGGGVRPGARPLRATRGVARGAEARGVRSDAGSAHLDDARRGGSRAPDAAGFQPGGRGGRRSRVPTAGRRASARAPAPRARGGLRRGVRRPLGRVGLVGVSGRKSTIAPPRPRAPEARRILTPSTRFFAPMPSTAARQQIAALETANAVRDAALLTAMAAMPHAVWFQASTPQEVQSAVHLTVIRATHEDRVPVLVAYNLPLRDCAQYGAGGAADAAAYAAWIDGFAKGIGNERVVVLLEPDSLGLIPYNTRLDGTADPCKPTVTDAQGKTVPAPGATAADRYALIGHALDSHREPGTERRRLSRRHAQRLARRR